MREVNAAEDHVAVTPQEFDELVRCGALAVHWQAHGLHYGIAREIEQFLGAGRCVLSTPRETSCPWYERGM